MDGRWALTGLAGRTRSPSTRQARPRCSHRESVVTTASRAVMVVKRSRYSTRRCVAAGWLRSDADRRAGQDNEEGRAPAGMHRLQIQNAANTQALQTVRALYPIQELRSLFLSFELGGEKKTKGAALTFVSTFQCLVLILLTVC